MKKTRLPLLLLFMLLLGSVQLFSQASSWSLVGSAGFNGASLAVGCNPSIAIYNNSNIYVAYGDVNYGYHTTVMKYNSSGWAIIGSPGFSTTESYDNYMAVDGNGTPYVAYNDQNLKITVMKYNGSNWDTVGNARFSIGSSINLVFDGLDTPYISYVDLSNGIKIAVRKFNGSSWMPVGFSAISIGTPSSPSLAIDHNGTPYIAFGDAAFSNKATVAKFDGTNWVDVGSSSFSPPSQYTELALSPGGTPYLLFEDSTQDSLTVMKYNGGVSWVNAGNTKFALGSLQHTSKPVTFDNAGDLYVAFPDVANGNNAGVMKLNGNTWQYLGNPGFSAGATDDVSIATYNNTPYVLYYDYASFDKLTVMKYTGPTSIGNVNAGEDKVQVYPNPAHDVLYVRGTMPATLHITNIYGQVVRLAHNTNSIDIATLPEGLYFVQVYDNSGTLLASQRLTKY